MACVYAVVCWAFECIEIMCCVSDSTSVDSPEWELCLSLPSVPYVLRMLAGLCKQHTPTQVAAVTAVERVHLLEQVSTEKHLGTLAENVLEAMMENPDCQGEVCVIELT